VATWDALDTSLGIALAAHCAGLQRQVAAAAAAGVPHRAGGVGLHDASGAVGDAWQLLRAYAPT